ncbi:MAG: hypothetical protein WC058_05125 [Phycisphaeraceae bacterium]
MVDRLSPSEVEDLLWDMCVILGFCLERKDQEQLAHFPPTDVESFVDAVFEAEKMDPQASPHLRQQVRELITKHFRDADIL